jgi:HEAT repeat protein
MSIPVQWEQPPEGGQLGGEEVPAIFGPEPEWVESGNPASLPLLVRYLRSEEEITQLAALAEFAGLGAKARSAVLAILQALRDPKGSIRVEAAMTLISLNARTEAAIRALIAELKAEDANDRARAARAIGKLVDPPDEFVISCWGPDPPPRIARPWVGKRALSALVDGLRDREPIVRARVAYTIGQIGRTARSAVPALRMALKDKDAAVRKAVSRTLKQVSRPATFTAVIN